MTFVKTLERRREKRRRYYDSHKEQFKAYQAEYQKRRSQLNPEVRAKKAEYLQQYAFSGGLLGDVAKVSGTPKQCVRRLAVELVRSLGSEVICHV